MRAASCFSGIGGAECAWPDAEWLWCAEIEPAPSEILAARFPHSTNLGDITAPDFIDRAKAMGPLDLLCGGPPCQAFSVAGLRGGMADPRGQLSISFVEIAHAIRPRNLLVENVPGWLNHPDNAFGCFLGAIVGADDALLPCECPPAGQSNAGWRWRKSATVWMLRELGDDGLPVYVDDHTEYDASEVRQVTLDARHVPVWASAGMAEGPRARAAWRVFDAQYFGLAQRRQRVFVVVDFGEGADPASVLFERDGGIGDPAKGRKAVQGVAGTLSARTEGGGGLGTDFDLAGGCQPVLPQGHEGQIAPTLNAAFGSKLGLDNQHIDGGGACSLPPVSLCLNAGAMGRLDPTFETLIPVNRCDFDDAVAHTLRGEGFDASEDGTGRGTPLVPVHFQDSEYGAQEYDTATIRAGRIPEHSMILEPVPICVHADAIGRTGEALTPSPDAEGRVRLRDAGMGISEDACFALTTGQPHAVAYRTSGNCGAWSTGDKVDALTTGTDQTSHVIAFTSKDHGGDATVDLSPTLRSMGHDGSHTNGGGQVAVAFAENQQAVVRLSEISPQLTCGGGKPGQGYPAIMVPPEEPFTIMEHGRDGQSSLEYRQDGTANAILTPNGGRGGLGVGAIATQWAVRRLTPHEAEKLQGYPPGHTLIETSKRRTVEPDEADYLRAHGAIVTLGNDGKLRTNAMADGPRYKGLGNAWAVPCARWIIARIAEGQGE